MKCGQTILKVQFFDFRFGDISCRPGTEHVGEKRFHSILLTIPRLLSAPLLQNHSWLLDDSIYRDAMKGTVIGDIWRTFVSIGNCDSHYITRHFQMIRSSSWSLRIKRSAYRKTPKKFEFEKGRGKIFFAVECIALGRGAKSQDGLYVCRICVSLLDSTFRPVELISRY